MLTLVPLAGHDWLAAALLWTAFLFLNETTSGSWGYHGIVRLFQGKAFVITALVPLLAALTVHWIRKGQALDLLSLFDSEIFVQSGFTSVDFLSGQ